MRVLFVTYRYPPQNYISSLRLGKLTKYLIGYGCEPWVLTIDHTLISVGNDLPVEIPDEMILRAGIGSFFKFMTKAASKDNKTFTSSLQIYKSSYSNNFGFIKIVRKLIGGLFSGERFPDRALPWVFPALKLGTDLLKKKKFDAIVSSFGPSSSHVVGSILSRRFDLPWIADYRDLWTQNHIVKRKGIFQWIETHIEKRIIRRAVHLTTVSNPLAEQLMQLHNKPVTVLINGFDEADFGRHPVVNQTDKFKIVYTGMVYPGKRDPMPVFEAVNLLKKQVPILGNNIELIFLGTDAAILTQMASSAGVTNQIVIHPRLSNDIAIRYQCDADMLLLLEWDNPSALGVFTGKIFEYVGARRPIIATGPKGGVIDKLLKETKSGELITSADHAACVIKKWWDRKKNTGSTQLPYSYQRLRPYTRRYQSRELFELLKKVINENQVVQ